VLHLLATMPVGGAEDLVAAAVKGLDPRRFEAAAACIGEPGAIGEELRAAGYPVASLGLDLRRTPFPRLIAAVRGLLKEMRPDILHTHLYHPNLYGRLAALGLNLPGVVAAVHNSYHRVKFHRRGWNFLLALVTDRVLVGSTRVWQDVRRFDGVPVRKLTLLPYGIPLAEPEPALSREEARTRLGVSGFVLGAVGRLEEQKGHRYLLEAVTELAGRLPDLKVLLVGEGRQRQKLESLVRELGVAEVVRFLGTRRDLPLIYRALDLFVLPSLWEGLPLALLQAMGSGLPVVATRVSGVQEAVQDGLTGCLVAPGDAGALTEAILELYARPKTRLRLGEAARATVRENYSQEAMLRQLERLYLEVLQSKGLRSAPGKVQTS
jgi:glycosyltransferase involved in cell wall biosynthesis